MTSYNSTNSKYGSLSTRTPPEGDDSREPVSSEQGPEQGQGGYEELFGGSVQCVSCRGTGRIPRDLEEQLVALIPLNDKRLRPRRTLRYVSLAVVLCLVVSSMLLFFLLPRSVDLQSRSPKLDPDLAIVNTTHHGSIFLEVQNYYNVTNNNFFSVRVEQFSITALFDTNVVGTTTNNTQLFIPMRSTQYYWITVNLTFTGDIGYMAYYCNSSLPALDNGHSLLIPFSATATVSYMGHTEEATLNTYQHVGCSPKRHHTTPSPLTIGPPSTTPSTTPKLMTIGPPSTTSSTTPKLT